jgi:hypothetical protein
MTGPAWLAVVLAAVAGTVALFSGLRLALSRGRRPGEADADGVHVLMGVAMAGMFEPRLATLPAAAWAAVFTAGAGWFAWQAARTRIAPARPARGRWCALPLPHLVDCLAMVYVLWAVPAARPGGSRGGMAATGEMSAMGSGARLPVLALALALGVCGYVVWLLDRLPARTDRLPAPSTAPLPAHGAGSTAPPSARRPAALAPRAATCCKVAMGVAMGVMLIGVV